MSNSIWISKPCKDCGKTFVSVRSVRRTRCAECNDKHFFTLKKSDIPLEFAFKG